MIVGALLLVIGIGGLFWPITPDIGNVTGTLSCNNALMLETENAKSQETTNAMLRNMKRSASDYPIDIAAQCEDTARVRRIVFWPVACLGAVALTAGFLLRPRRADPA